ncbi:MAG TPA: alpha/beta fold hydrolase [Thermoanaerobaculia bacterium]
MIRRLSIPLLLLFAVACASSDDYDTSASRVLPRGPYSGNETGPSPVGAIPDISVRDAARNRDLLLSVEYPTRGGPHPVILFSHEYGGSNRSYIGLSSYWSSNGYVVIRPAHLDRGGPDAQGERDWQNRVRDITAVIDSLETLEQRYPELQGKIDRTKIAVAGHGYGGQTALLLANDPRVKAVVAMVPETRGVTFTDLKVPVLFFSGTRDPAQTASEPFTLAPAGDKWLVSIEGARMPAFTGRYEAFTEAQAREAARNDPIMDPYGQQQQQRSTRVQNAMLRTQEMFGIVRGGALAFLDLYVKGNADARQALEGLKDRRGVTIDRK